MAVSKQILIFSMCFLGTRCVITSLILTGVFTILSDHVFNEESKFCVVPQKWRVLEKTMDTNNDGEISDKELQDAILLIERAKNQKKNKKNKELFKNFHEYTKNEQI
jgi:hypothetical protein